MNPKKAGELLKLALIVILAFGLSSCTEKNPLASGSSAGSSSSSGSGSTPTATPIGGGVVVLPTPTPCASVSIVVNNSTAVTVQMILDGKPYVNIASGGSYTFVTCPGTHAFTMAGVGGTGPTASSMNYNPAYPICGRAYTCTTSFLTAGTYTIAVTQTVSPMACASEIDWACP